MKYLKSYCSSETEIKKSKFLTEAFCIETQVDARNLLKFQKQKYSNATHVVHTFIVGKQGEIMGCSDDGEPSGTAGKPALNVLKNADITNILITITRWFGGTLLGTGGLVKAYSNAIKNILSKIETDELIERSKLKIICSYSDYNILSNHLSSYSFNILKTDYKEVINIIGEIPKNQENNFMHFIKEKTGAQAQVIKLNKY